MHEHASMKSLGCRAVCLSFLQTLLDDFLIMPYPFVHTELSLRSYSHMSLVNLAHNFQTVQFVLSLCLAAQMVESVLLHRSGFCISHNFRCAAFVSRTLPIWFLPQKPFNKVKRTEKAYVSFLGRWKLHVIITEKIHFTAGQK